MVTLWHMVQYSILRSRAVMANGKLLTNIYSLIETNLFFLVAVTPSVMHCIRSFISCELHSLIMIILDSRLPCSASYVRQLYEASRAAATCVLQRDASVPAASHSCLFVSRALQAYFHAVTVLCIDSNLASKPSTSPSQPATSATPPPHRPLAPSYSQLNQH